jgi:hydrogenase-4 component B
LLDLGSSDAPLYIVGTIDAAILVAVAALTVFLVDWLRNAGKTEGPTWSCGYVRPTTRMQYTGRSFTEMLARRLLPRLVRPTTNRRGPEGLFPAAGDFESEMPDPVSEKGYEPFFRSWAERFSRLRVLQQGQVHVYVAYILFVVVLALTWVSARTWWASWWATS